MTENQESPKWYQAEVIQVNPHLGHGFVKGQIVGVRKSWVEGEWIVYNGNYGDRRLTTEQAKASVKTKRSKYGKQVVHIGMESKFQFNLTR